MFDVDVLAVIVPFILRRLPLSPSGIRELKKKKKIIIVFLYFCLFICHLISLSICGIYDQTFDKPLKQTQLLATCVKKSKVAIYLPVAYYMASSHWMLRQKQLRKQGSPRVRSCGLLLLQGRWGPQGRDTTVRRA